jgi:hypothetical protein
LALLEVFSRTELDPQATKLGLSVTIFFWKIDFSVVFIFSFPKNIISVFVLGFAVREVIQCMFNLTLVLLYISAIFVNTVQIIDPKFYFYSFLTQLGCNLQLILIVWQFRVLPKYF